MKSENNIEHKRWYHSAVCLGYNELAKQAKTFGEKVYFILGRNLAETRLEELGGKSVIKPSKIVLVLPDHMPHIKFTEKDIDLMREFIRDYDEKKSVV